MAADISLLENPIRVWTPFIKVTIGTHTFGVQQLSNTASRNASGAFKSPEGYYVQFPNFIQNLSVRKINGQVNTYDLTLKYAITPGADPNFFEKVLSEVSSSRSIVFSYGDLSTPAFLYREEEALITKVTNQFDVGAATITYNISAISKGTLASSGSNYFPAYAHAKPSDIIKKLLQQNDKYGLCDLFTGMRDLAVVEKNGWIDSSDQAVTLEAQFNMSVLDYLRYLVSCMKSSDSQKGIYTFVVVDDVANDVASGPYFKVVNTETAGDTLDTYTLDVGYPSNAIVTDFRVDNNESYSIFYDYQTQLNETEYVKRIDNDGNMINVFAQTISSNNVQATTRPQDESWWKNVTQYPISAQIRLKGLLRPAILMSKVRLNVLYYGQKHISSGLYIITKQLDEIGLSGVFTTLNLVRVAGDQ